MSELKVDRKKLAEYLKKHADVVAQKADLSIDTEEIRSMDGVSAFRATVRLYIEEIPLEIVKA